MAKKQIDKLPYGDHKSTPAERARIHILREAQKNPLSEREKGQMVHNLLRLKKTPQEIADILGVAISTLNEWYKEWVYPKPKEATPIPQQAIMESATKVPFTKEDKYRLIRSMIDKQKKSPEEVAEVLQVTVGTVKRWYKDSTTKEV